MSFQVKVRQLPDHLMVQKGQTILDAAQAAGFDFPCGCQSGNCGACKSILISGQVEMSGYSDFALTDEEKAAGQILACCALPSSDCDLAWLEPDEIPTHTQRKLECSVAAVTRLTHDTMQVDLKIDGGGPFAFSAGQYAAVTFPGWPSRDYSMASQSGDGLIEFHIRAMGEGAVSQYVNRDLKAGDKVLVEGPKGVAFLREGHKGPIYAFAGGSGLAPIKAIITRALKINMTQEIHLYFGVRDEPDLYGEGFFRALEKQHTNFRFIPVLSQAAGASSRKTGFLADVIRAELPKLDYAKAYLAGPPIMVETCVAALQEKGLARQDCHADAFFTEADKPKPA